MVVAKLFAEFEVVAAATTVVVFLQNLKACFYTITLNIPAKWSQRIVRHNFKD